jgi:ferredoxin
VSDSFEITIEDTGESFVCGSDQVVLKAMVALGRRGIPSGCHGGGCGICKVEVRTGTYQTGFMSRDHITLEEQRRGVVLACQLYPRSDIEVKVLGRMRKAVSRERRFGLV